MATYDLHLETGTTINIWRSGLGSIVTTRLYQSQPGLRRRFGDAGRVRFRRIVETLLAHIAPAILRGQPEIFANYVAHDAARAAGIGVCAEDFTCALEQVGDALRHHLPGRRGELACEYVRFALAKLPRHGLAATIPNFGVETPIST